MRLVVLLVVLLLTAGCGQRTIELDSRWRPLEKIVAASWVQSGWFTTIGPHMFAHKISEFTDMAPVFQEGVLIHEQVHARRQLNGGPGWYRDYAAFPSFRWEEEKAAYEPELKYYKSQGVQIDIDYYAKQMSSGKYSMTSFEVARAWIGRVLQ